MAIKKFIGTRGIGKTSRLLDYAAENGIKYVICLNPKHMMEMAHSLGVTGLTYINYSALEDIQNIINSKEKFVVDNIEDFLSLNCSLLQGFTCNLV